MASSATKYNAASKLGLKTPPVAAGFALLALGETRVLNPTDVPGGEASFAAGVLLYVPGLLMIALSTWHRGGFV